jgi:hypothetical protein
MLEVEVVILLLIGRGTTAFEAIPAARGGLSARRAGVR